MDQRVIHATAEKGEPIQWQGPRSEVIVGSSSKVPVGSTTDSRPIDLQVEQAPHAIEAAAVAKKLQVDPSSGLSSAEVAQCRSHYGANALQTAHSRPAWRRA